MCWSFFVHASAVTTHIRHITTHSLYIVPWLAHYVYTCSRSAQAVLPCSYLDCPSYSHQHQMLNDINNSTSNWLGNLGNLGWLAQFLFARVTTGFFSISIPSWHIICQLNQILLTIPAPVCNLWCFFPSSWLCMCLTQAQFHSLAITFFQIGLYYQAIKQPSGNSGMCCSLHCLLFVTGNEEECECYKCLHVTID